MAFKQGNNAPKKTFCVHVGPLNLRDILCGAYADHNHQYYHLGFHRPSDGEQRVYIECCEHYLGQNQSGCDAINMTPENAEPLKLRPPAQVIHNDGHYFRVARFN